jgi:hypothetical protein
MDDGWMRILKPQSSDVVVVVVVVVLVLDIDEIF